MKNILSYVLFVCFLEAHLQGSGHVGVCEVAVEFLLLVGEGQHYSILFPFPENSGLIPRGACLETGGDVQSLILSSFSKMHFPSSCCSIPQLCF